MTETDDKPKGGRIEAGVDAVVIGVGLYGDGLVAAAGLAKAGLKTVLLEAARDVDASLAEDFRLTGPPSVYGEHVVRFLDRAMLDDLALYRRGLSFSPRLLDTKYLLSDGESRVLEGDLLKAIATAAALNENERPAARLLHGLFDAADDLAAIFAGEEEGAAMDRSLSGRNWALDSRMSVLDGLRRAGVAGALTDIFSAEACLGGGEAPHDAYGFARLQRRFAGEAAGLRGAAAYPAGGPPAIFAALRRAAQTAKAELRFHQPVDEIIIEWDAVAGVSLGRGGQIRAPIVVSAADASRTFIELVGAHALDVAFQHAIAPRRPEIATVAAHISVRDLPLGDPDTSPLRRRIVIAPHPDDLIESFIDARAGRLPRHPIVELIAPAALDAAAPAAEPATLIARVHPVPHRIKPSDGYRDAIAARVPDWIAAAAPTMRDHIVGMEIVLPQDMAAMTGVGADHFAAEPAVIDQIALARVSAGADAIDGLFFCGPEAQVGRGFCGAAGRIAAGRAARYFRKAVR